MGSSITPSRDGKPTATIVIVKSLTRPAQLAADDRHGISAEENTDGEGRNEPTLS